MANIIPLKLKTVGGALVFHEAEDGDTLPANMKKGAIAGGVYTDPSLPVFSATPTFDCSASNVFEPEAMTANVTSVTMSNAAAGQTVQIRFMQDATGGRTVTVPAGAKIDGTPNTSANRVNWLVMTYSSRASRWEGNWLVVPS